MKKNRLMTCPGQVTIEVHQPIPTPKIDTPTTADARRLAARVEEIVRAGVRQTPELPPTVLVRST
jgi:hypothetical protein